MGFVSRVFGTGAPADKIINPYSENPRQPGFNFFGADIEKVTKICKDNGLTYGTDECDRKWPQVLIGGAKASAAKKPAAKKPAAKKPAAKKPSANKPEKTPITKKT